MPPGLRMALRSGARLGPYEIVSAIGAGRSAAWRMPWTPGRPPRRARQRRRQSRHPHAVRSPRKAPIGGHAYARLFQGLAGDAGMSLHPGRPPTAATDRNRCEQPAPERFCQAKERCNIASRFGLSYLSAALCLCAVEAITIMTKPKTDLLAWQSADGASRLFCGDSFEILPTLPDESVDCVWTDPPYLLSNDGITCVAGKMVKVNKGEGDRSRGVDLDHEFSVNRIVALIDAKEDETLARAAGQHSRQHAGPDHLVVPFLLHNLPPERRAALARFMPPVVTRLLVPIVWRRKWAPMRPFLLP